jgi:hypothetical protein
LFGVGFEWSLKRSSSVKLEALGREVSEGLLTICTDRNPSILFIETADAVSGDRVQVANLKPGQYSSQSRNTGLKINHGEESSTIELRVEDRGLVKTTLK